MPNAFSFVYQRWQCGTVETVEQSDAPPRPETLYDRPRVRADAALRDAYEWARARPDSICPECKDE